MASTRSDGEKADNAFVQGFLQDVHAHCGIRRDLDTWSKERLVNWSSGLREYRQGEVRRAWKGWKDTHDPDQEPSLGAFLKLVMSARTQQAREPGQPCAECRSRPGLREIVVRLGKHPNGAPHVMDYVARCTCPAARKVTNLPELEPSLVALTKRHGADNVKLVTREVSAGMIRRLWGEGWTEGAIVITGRAMRQAMAEPPREPDWMEQRPWQEVD